MPSTRTILVLWAGSLAVLWHPIAFAQGAEVLEEIIVTSERREASLQEVPLAVSAFGMGQIENLQITEAQDLQFYVPSLNMFGNIVSPTNLSLSLRGGLIQDASVVAAESPVGIYIDDIYLGRVNGNNVRLSDLERIEVLRGPQGTLYGRNTAYGAIRFISRTPGTEPWLDATIGAGNDEQLLFSASAGGPLGDAWAGSLAGRWYEKDEQYFNVAENEDVDNQENLSLRGKLRFMGVDNFDAVLSITYSDSQHDSLQLPNGTTPNIPENQDLNDGLNQQYTTDDLVFTNGAFKTNTAWEQLDPSPLGNKPEGETQQTIVGLTLSYDITENLTLRSITGYVNVEDDWHTDLNGNTADPAVFGFIGATEVDSDQYTQELQLLGTAFDEKLNYLLGAFYLTDDSDQLFGWNYGGAATAPPFSGALSQQVIDTEVDSISVFGEGTYQVTDSLRVTAGLRWTKDDKEMTYDFERFADNFFDVFVVPGFLPAITERIELDEDFDEWTPRFALDYTIENAGAVDSMLLYAQAARGFKAGGFSAISIVTTEAVGVYDPETNWTYEGGIKADWFGNRLRTNLAYFFSDIEDKQENATAGFEFPVQNSGDAEIEGLEFEISAVPIPGLTLFMSGALLSGDYKDLQPDSQAAQAPVVWGVQPDTPQTPDYAISVGFNYTFDFPVDFIGDVAFGADYYEIDDYITASTNDFNNSGWDVWNAFISVDVAENWQVKLTGKNLDDSTNVTSGSLALGGYVLLPPREWLLSVSYRM